MTANKRIAINVVATYLRSIYSVILGLFTARWALAALGEVDYGLWGLIGGLVGFISFLNSLLGVSTSRFFAYSVGQRHGVDGESGLFECRAWFSAAFAFHLVLGIVLVSIGYPVGVWAVRAYLAIPPDRIEACVWVWRIVCLNCFFGMINVPFYAMYNARQEIAEMTLYGVATATANAIFLYYIVTHPGVWLVKYALWNTVFIIVPMILMCIRAFCLFDECRFVVKELRNVGRMLRMVSYSTAQFFADFAALVSTQGVSVVVNRMLGPVYNASMGIANRVSEQTLTLGSAMIGALSPAITNAAGAGQFERMRILSYQSCKLSVLFVSIFAIPVALEADEIMVLWLGRPPADVGVLCSLLLLSFMVNRLTTGLSSSIEALGKIAAFKFAMGLAGFCPLILSWLFLRWGWGMRGVGLAILLTNIPFTIIRLYYSKKLAGIHVVYWFKTIFVPVTVVVAMGFAAGFLPVLCLPQSFVRVVVTTGVVCCVVVPAAWFLALTGEERSYVSARVHKILGRGA